MSEWTIAAVQMDCQLGDPAANLASIRARLAEAAAQGARLIVFPECILTGYAFASRAEAMPFGETVPGPSTTTLQTDCERLRVWVVLGMLERVGERLFNAAVLLGPDGQVAVYRKVHLPCLGIDRFTTPGDQPFAVHELPDGQGDVLRLGMTICYDGSFPEASRILALQGADLIVLPTNWPEGARRTARLLVPARALENHLFYLAVNRVGEERGFRFIGMSRIVQPNGEDLALCEKDHETILSATLDPTRARQKRIVHIAGEYEVDRVGDRRPELYGPLTLPRQSSEVGDE